MPIINQKPISQQLTLPGTPANDVIYQSYFRIDAAFRGNVVEKYDPRRRTAFALFSDGGVLLESGYAKLDEIVRKGNGHSYKITLYGSLGNALYNLDVSGGRKRTLANLNYRLGSTSWPAELDFTITAAAVRQAWDRLLSGQGGTTTLWDIINFAPCYNGVPEGFDAKHALIDAASNGLETSVTEEGVTYRTNDGWALVDLKEDMTEWQVRDLRSYLQRPVLSVYALFRAIGNAVTLDLDTEFFRTSNPYYYGAWMTLPLLSTLSVTPSGPRTWGPYTGERWEPAGEPSGAWSRSNQAWAKTKGTVSIKYEPRLVLDGNDWSQGEDLRWSGVVRNGGGAGSYYRGQLVQAVAYDAQGNTVGASEVYSVSCENNGQLYTTQQLASLTGYTPHYALDDQWGSALYGNHFADYNDTRRRWEARWAGASLLEFSFEAKQFTRVIVYVDQVVYFIPAGGQSQADPLGLFRQGSGGTTWVQATATNLFEYDEFEYTGEDIAEVRSGTLITKEMLLGGTMSPAEFLLSYCKRFGLYMSMDPGRNVLSIMTRKTWYSLAAGSMDLSGWVCRDRDVSVIPRAADKRRLRWAEGDAGAAWVKEYDGKHSTAYGNEVVDTGYDFDADTEDVLAGTVLKGAPEVMERDMLFVDVSGPHRPAAFLKGGLTYGLFDDSGRLNDMQVPGITGAATLTYWNRTYKGYDKVSRVQMHGDDGKAVDGTGVLLFFTGESKTYPYIFVTDDLPQMYLGGRDKPCWILDPAERMSPFDPTGAQPVPLFGRYLYDDAARTEVARSLDFGTPLELDIPGVTLDPETDVYHVFWSSFIADRYNRNTKVITLYVSTRGLAVDASLLRRFFWIDGALWVLSKIGPYDMGGDGVTKCEFVQVQDPDDYLDYPDLT